MKILSVDIGGTFLKYALMDETATFLERGKLVTPQEGREALIDVLAKLYERFPEAEGISISMPGIIDTQTGRCLMGGALQYNTGFDIRDALQERCSLPVYVENDAKCAAMAEAAIGSLKDVKNGLVLIFGTMIGGGILLNGELIRGTHFSAGEVSYLISTSSKKPEAENLWGNQCGVPRLCRLYAEKKEIPESTVDGMRVFGAVAQGDTDAIEALHTYTHDIAVQIFNLQTVLDPERIAIGGGISAQPVLLDYIQKNLDVLYQECPYPIPHAQIVACAYQNDANLVGALQGFLKEVHRYR